MHNYSAFVKLDTIYRIDRNVLNQRETFMYTMNLQCSGCHEKRSRAVNLSTNVSDVRAMRAYSLLIDSS